MASYGNLLAKGWRPGSGEVPPEHVRLAAHLQAVRTAAESIVDTCGDSILCNLSLDDRVWMPRLRIALSISALLHDLGKANSYFQGMVRGKPNFPAIGQPIRHELISALLLQRNCGGLADWVRRRLTEAGQAPVVEQLFKTIVGAVAGHHLKMGDDWKEAFRAPHQGGGGVAIDLFLSHKDLRSIFSSFGSDSDQTWSLLKSDATYPGKSQPSFNIDCADWADELRAHSDWRRFAAAVKALCVASDVAGSALTPRGVSLADWISDALGRRASPDRFASVAERRLAGRPLRQFQHAIANAGARVTLVEAACGSGKTAAAYLWAAKRCQGRKLFYCYPTTGTATEGFLDYVAASGLEAELIHSRASVDLQRVAMTGETEPCQEVEDEQLRIASLRSWTPEVVVCTVDTVLALVRNNRRGLYASPAILSGCFVLDEVHAYDDEMFAAAVAFIRALPNAPLLLMSASLPSRRKDLLHREIGEIGAIPTPAELEAIPRYSIRRTEREDAFSRAVESVHGGAKVLWVCNTVVRAQAIFDRAKAEGIDAVAYHSRFRYEDRVARHRDLVDRFSDESGPGLLGVTTQVAEMSLDLDADLLVTELAPIPSLIQRLGRLNRRVSECRSGSPRFALILSPDDRNPYDSDSDWLAAEAWVDRLAASPDPIRQCDLSAAFVDLAEASPSHLDLRMEWLDSGWHALPGAVREPGLSVNVLLEEDLAACRADRAELAKRTFPMPFRKRIQSWSTFGSAFVAPSEAIAYDRYRGAAWAN